MKKQDSFTKGFSLVELITVIVLISVLGVAAIGRFSGLSGFEVRGFFDDTVAAMRYAQNLSVSTGCPVQVTITANQYQLHQGTACFSGVYTRNVLNPSDRVSAYTNTAPTGISISPTGTYVFSPQSSVSGIAVDTTFTIDSYQFVLYQHTGLIDVL